MARAGSGRVRGCIPLTLVIACLLAVVPPAGGAPPGNWTAALQPAPGGGTRSPEGRIVLDLPVDLDPAILPRLVLEVDNLDVSALLAIEGLSLGYTPPTPLVAGAHRVRLAQYAEDGTVTERGSFTLQVSFPPSAVASFTNEVAVNAVWRAAESDLPEGSTPQDPWQVTLSDHLGTEPAYGALGGNLGTELLVYSSDSLSSSGTDYADLGAHLLKARGGPLTLNAGLHGPGPESIVLQGFSRRGLSGDLTLLGGGVGATAFVMRVTPASGLKDFVGMDDPGNRVAGTTVAVRPWPTQPARLLLTATFLDGEGPEGTGTAVEGDPLVAGGQAWGFAAEGAALADRIRYRGEYAGSTYDFDAADPEAGEQQGDAWSARVAVTPVKAYALAKRPFDLDVEGEYRHVGTFFKSIGNPGLSADRNTFRGATRAAWGWVALEGSLERSEDNADGWATLPRLRNSVGRAVLTLGPLAHEAAAAVVGPATLSVNWRSAADRSVSVPEGYEGTGTDRDARDIGVRLSSTLSRWGWGLGWTNGREVDNSGAYPEVRRDLADASLSLRPWDPLTLGLSGQWLSSSDPATDISRDTLTSTLSTSLAVVPEVISLNGSWQYSTERASDDSADAVTSQVEAELAWQLAVGKGWPTFRTSLKGQYRSRDDRLDDAMDESFYQLFLGLSAAWPYAAGSGAQGVPQ